MYLEVARVYGFEAAKTKESIENIDVDGGLHRKVLSNICHAINITQVVRSSLAKSHGKRLF